jgi:hypothetical protein
LTKYSPVAGLPTMKGGSCNERPIDVGMIAYIGIFPYTDQDTGRLTQQVMDPLPLRRRGLNHLRKKGLYEIRL